MSIEKMDLQGKEFPMTQETDVMTMVTAWQELVDPLLLHIFGYLSPVELLHCSESCWNWYRVALDESLWKQHVYNRWNIRGEMPPGMVSWLSEYKRLCYYAPTECNQVIKQHTDEVLDVCFSHNGQFFCTTSKDATVRVWKIEKNREISQCYKDNLLIKLGWNLTQYSVFNRADTLLLVCGVRISTLPTLDPNPDTYTPMGYGAVYNMNNFQLLTVMVMDPPHLFGDWYDERTCVGGYQDGMDGVFKVKSYKISEKEKYSENKSGKIICEFEGDSRRAMNLMVVKVPQTLVTSLKSKNINQSQQRYTVSARGTRDAKTRSKVTNEVNNVASPVSDTTTKKFVKLVVIVTGAHHDKLAFYEVKGGLVELDRQVGQNRNHSARVSRTVNRHNIDDPIHTVLLPGRYISGLRISLDERYLFVNSRQCHIPHEGAEYPELLQDLVIQAVDLHTCKLVPEIKLSGHKAYSDFPAWYICLDASQYYVVSGSEEAMAYLWDRHYGCILKTFQHDEGVVNGVSFNPVDMEMMVTVGDDHNIKIWCSKNKLKNLPSHNKETECKKMNGLDDLKSSDVDCSLCSKMECPSPET